MALGAGALDDACGHVDAHDALQEMKDATMQLDAILQQLCAAQRTASDASDALQRKQNDNEDDKDDAFADATEWRDNNELSSAAVASDALPQDASQQPHAQIAAAGFDSIESYFEVHASSVD